MLNQSTKHARTRVNLGNDIARMLIIKMEDKAVDFVVCDK